MLMGALLLGIGAGAFGVSVLLRHLGITALWLRYGLTTVLAYMIFVTVLTVLARRYRSTHAQAGADSASKTSLLDLFDPGVGDIAGAADDPAGCLLIIGIIVAIVAAFFVVNAAGLLADLTLDVVVVGTAWKRLQRSLSDHWVHVLKRTLLSGFLVLFVVTLGAAIVQVMVPGATTIGDVFHARSHTRR